MKSSTQFTGSCGRRRRNAIIHFPPILLLLIRLAAVGAEPPRLQILDQPGRWPEWPRGGAPSDIKVVGTYAYVALGSAGLAVLDVSNPARCRQVGGCLTGGNAVSVAVGGNRA